MEGAEVNDHEGKALLEIEPGHVATHEPNPLPDRSREGGPLGGGMPQHWLRYIQADDIEPRAGQGQGDAAGAGTELEDGSAGLPRVTDVELHVTLDRGPARVDTLVVGIDVQAVGGVEGPWSGHRGDGRARRERLWAGAARVSGWMRRVALRPALAPARP